jgi:chloride channel protein, CIC family
MSAAEPIEPVEPVAPSPRPRFGSFFWRDPNTRFLILAAVAGILGALGAVVFRTLTTRLTGLLLDASDIVSGAEALPPALRVFLPAVGGLVGGLLLIWLVDEKGPSGISQMIDAVSLGRRAVRVKPAVGRVVSSIAVISTGGSEGREGPIIQIGAALASGS